MNDQEAGEAAVAFLMTNHERAEAVFAIEQGLRVIERYRSPTCVEHGFPLSRCRERGLYHANGKVRHGCIKGNR